MSALGSQNILQNEPDGASVAPCIATSFERWNIGLVSTASSQDIGS